MPNKDYQRFHNGAHFLNKVILDIDTDIYCENENQYGWRDLFSQIEPRGGTNSPTWTIFRNGIYAYAFTNTKMTEAFTSFHLDHDYALNTKVYPHIHFSVSSSTLSGTVRWGFEFTFAKGHAQASGSIFPASTIIYVDTVITGSTDQYKHFIAEVSDINAIQSINLEPDTLILCRVFRDITVPGNYAGNVFGFQVDLHYQVGRLFTKNKKPQFYT